MLQAAGRGDEPAAARLLRFGDGELGRMANALMAGNVPSPTLNTTALVHEAYVRLIGKEPEPDWQSRRHYFMAAARAMRDGLAWLDGHWSVTGNPEAAKTWHYYYLYGLERVGVLSDRKWIGKHDWYREGATEILDHQAAGGAWQGAGMGPLVDTPFALLFLKRATMPLRRPAFSPGGK